MPRGVVIRIGAIDRSAMWLLMTLAVAALHRAGHPTVTLQVVIVGLLLV
jgi:hypothetical protein